MNEATVVITCPDGHQRRLAMRVGGLRVGRAPDNDLVIAAPGVAPYHAVIHCAGQDSTRLGGSQPFGAGAPLRIEVPAGGEAGAAVRIGGYTIRMRPALTAPRDPAAG
jgi:hypothetical protein